MTTRSADFLVSTGTPDEPYGLYVMERDSVHHTEDSVLVYHFDSDDFTRVPRAALAFFVPSAQLQSCRDGFGGEYTGAALAARIGDAIRAYREELPGHEQAKTVLDESLTDLEE